MKTSVIKNVIADQNAKNKQKDLIERDIFKRAFEMKKQPFIKIITGMRRCGKSTLVKQIREKSPGYYINFDDDRLASFSAEDFQTLLEAFIEMLGESDVFYFDEIQNVEGWELFARRLHDEGKQVYITGSNATMLSRELGAKLTGRHVQIELFPFSFVEYLRFIKADYDVSNLHETATKGKLRKYFKNYIENGGVPDYVRYGSEEYLKTLFDNILYRDVIARYNLTSDRQIKELTLFAAQNISNLVSYNSLRQMIGVKNATTVKNYFDYLENSYLLSLVPKFEYSVKRQVFAPKKCYFIDTGMAKRLRFSFSADEGRALENAAYLHLKRKGGEIYYYKGIGECDFVHKKSGEVNLYQVCAELSQENKEREFDGLVEALDKLGLERGTILTTDEEGETTYKDKKIKIAPMWKTAIEE